MNSNRLDTFHRGSEVRHLLLEGEDHGARKLTTLINGVRTEMATGTTYEMDKQSQTVMEEWRKEGFKYRRDEDAPVFGPRKDVIALAKLMGFTRVIRPNKFPMQEPLDSWQGCRDSNGDDYEYALVVAMIHARAKLTAKHGINMAPKDNEELMATFKKAFEVRKALGPDCTFVVG
jgi:hypothetical protein